MQHLCGLALGTVAVEPQLDQLTVLLRERAEHLFQTDAIRQCFLRGFHRDIQLMFRILSALRGQAHGGLCRLDGHGHILHALPQLLCQLGEGGLVTNFGKFMDPLADKLLVSAAMICLVSMDRLPAWMVIIIISREFAISGFRLIAADNGIVIAASWWGKFKTVSQMIMIILLIANLGGIFTVLENVFMWIALILTVVSLADYIWKNKKVLSMQS